MANRWCDGFGRYGGDKTKMLNGSSSQAWANVGSTFSLSNVNPRTGSWHVRLSGSAADGGDLRRVVGEAVTEGIWGFAMHTDALPPEEGEDGVLFAFRDQANVTQFYIVFGTDGALEVRRDGVVLGRTIPIIGAGAYQHLEIYARASETDGAIEIRVDEVTRLSLSGIATVTSEVVSFSQVAVKDGIMFNRPTIDFADCYFNDTVVDGSGCHTFIGDCKSGCRFVDADTAQADFALSAGSDGFALLDDAPPNDATYISTSATTAESDFGIADGPANLTEILTVRPFVRAQKDDAGTALIAPNMISDSVKGTVTEQPVTTAFAYYDSNVPLNPDTDAPWSPSEFNAALHVVERTA